MTRILLLHTKKASFLARLASSLSAKPYWLKYTVMVLGIDCFYETHKKGAELAPKFIYLASTNIYFAW
jgi:hypothetical protein